MTLKFHFSAQIFTCLSFPELLKSEGDGERDFENCGIPGLDGSKLKCEGNEFRLPLFPRVAALRLIIFFFRRDGDLLKMVRNSVVYCSSCSIVTFPSTYQNQSLPSFDLGIYLNIPIRVSSHSILIAWIKLRYLELRFKCYLC